MKGPLLDLLAAGIEDKDKQAKQNKLVPKLVPLLLDQNKGTSSGKEDGPTTWSVAVCSLHQVRAAEAGRERGG